MGKIKSCEFACDDGLVYRPGESISGTVTIDVEGDMKVNRIFVSCHGQAVTRWRRPFQKVYEDDAMGREVYLREYICLLKSADSPHVLTTGKRTYNFKFILPSHGLPSSFEGHRGAIAYWLRFEVEKPFPSLDDKYHACFTVLAHLDANEQVYKRSPQSKIQKTISKALGFGNAGTLTLSASLDRTGYCPGEKISINLEAKNESSKDLGYVKATLVQHVEYQAGSETDSTTRPIASVQGAKLGKNQTCVWDKQLLDIDAIPPSTKKLTCQIIQVSYHVIVAVEVPMGTDLELKLSIKICTAPLGVSIPVQARSVGNGKFQVDKSRTLTYVQCRAGLQIFGEPMDNFVSIKNFFPLTCFAKNYNPASTSAAPGTPRTVSRPSSATPATTKSSAASTATVTPRPSTAAAAKPLSSSTTPTKPPPSAAAKSTALPRASPSPTNLRQAVTPSAPPMPSMTSLEPPPSYEAACAPSTLGLPTPYYVQPEPGKGSLLLLLFPLVDVHLVSGLFKRQVPNMLLHGGKTILYTPTITVIPSKETAAILIHFGAQRTALSWLQNMTSSDPNLTSKWWALVSENKTDLGPIGDLNTFKAITLNLFSRKSDHKLTKAFSDEYLRLVKEAMRPAKARHGAKTIMSGKMAFACGDWSSFPAKASAMTLSVVQFPSLEHVAAYRAEYKTEPDLIKLKEMTNTAHTILSTHSLETGNTSLFQDC